IKVVAPNGSAPGFGRALLRVVGYGFSLLPAGWGFLRIAVDPMRQALHDRIADTLVIPEKVIKPIPAGLPGYRQPIQAADSVQPIPRTATGWAALAAAQEYDRGQLMTVPQLPETRLYQGALPIIPRPDAEAVTIPPSALSGLDTHSERVEPKKQQNVDKARALFKFGLEE